MKRNVLLSLLLFISFQSWSQQTDYTLFDIGGELRTIYLQRHRINDKYTFNFDAGSYLGVGTNEWVRWGFRGNLQRKVSDFYTVAVGFMYNKTTVYEEIEEWEDPDDRAQLTRHEYRPQQSLIVNYPRFKSSALRHRLQLEERIFDHIHENIRDFSIRLRYLVQHQGRFDGKPIAPKSLYYRAFAEFNFNIYEEADDLFWIRGRYWAGLGYQFNSKLKGDFNYCYEHSKVSKDIDPLVKHIFQLTLRHTIHWQNKG
ncbi:DUF2490 domain-containing protein [Carboxylicivirga marina]|uniref:DUF2490 domain-containing protein n=1 Tax=Carboxylicivirga marina TaxID=2800988 RepID=A0ABS1HL88_9BACT|nr:DUF2490 domain-containing protein [Carboxylicivirga marina]MBK3518371.1 DUF2490 domain-containing protein [Carboxylicivirga marina]